MCRSHAGMGSDVRHGDPKEATHKENVRATEDRFWDLQLGARYCNQQKTQTKDNDGSPQEFSSAIKQVTHHAFPV